MAGIPYLWKVNRKANSMKQDQIKNTENSNKFVTPPPNTEATDYRAMYSGSMTSRLAATFPSFSKILDLDDISGIATIEDPTGQLMLSIDGYSPEDRLNIFTHKLNHILLIELTKQNSYQEKDKSKINERVRIPLTDIVEMLGLEDTPTNRKNVRRKVQEGLETLFKSRLSWTETGYDYKKKTTAPIDFGDIRVITAKGIRNNIITVAFDRELAFKLVNDYVMEIPLDLFKIDERNLNCYPLSIKMLQHYNMTSNVKRSTHNILSVKTLLNYCPSIPDIEVVRNSNYRSTTNRIIDPFEKALDQIAETVEGFYWNYCNPNKECLDDEQITVSDYDTFINLLVHFEFTTHKHHQADLKFLE